MHTQHNAPVAFLLDFAISIKSFLCLVEFGAKTRRVLKHTQAPRDALAGVGGGSGRGIWFKDPPRRESLFLRHLFYSSHATWSADLVLYGMLAGLGVEEAEGLGELGWGHEGECAPELVV